MSPRLLRLGSGLAILIALLLVPIELTYRGEVPLQTRLLAHGAFTLLATVGLAVSFLPLAPRSVDNLALLIVVGMGANALFYFAATPGYPPLLANTLTLLLFGGTVICAWSPRRTALVGTLFAQGFLLTGLLAHRVHVPEERFILAIGTLLLASVIAAFCATVMEGARDDIVHRENDLEGLSNRLMSVQEEERRRLSRELHDGVGQGLTAVVSHLWLLERRMPEGSQDLRTSASEARALAAKTLAEIRELSQLLRPSLLDDWGLVPSLEAHVKAFKTHHDIEVSFSSTTLPERLPAEVETAVYRIVQEALTNVARHAKARTVRVNLEHSGAILSLDVTDDGVGYPRKDARDESRGLGLLSIRERVRALGGRVALNNDHGAHLAIEIPLAT